MTKDIDSACREVLKVLEEARRHLAFVTAGGGVGLFQLFRVKGCSRVMSEAGMLYEKESFARYLGTEPAHPFVSEETSLALAQTLFDKTGAGLCFALTCALQTDRERKGRDRGFLCILQGGTVTDQLEIDVQGNTRLEQDVFITLAVLNRIHDLTVSKP